MQLLTDELKRKLPKLYSTEDTPTNEKLIVVKFFCPWNQWTWYIVEGEESHGDWVFFGYTIGDANEWGYITLSELESVEKFGMGIERDLYFEPCAFGECEELRSIQRAEGIR